MRSHNTVKSMPRSMDLTAPDSPLTAWRNNMMKTAETEDKRDLMAGMSSSAIPQKKSSNQVVPQKVSQQLTRPISSSTTKSARRQFRESMREIAGVGDSSSDCSSLPRQRPQRSISHSQASRDKSRVSGSATATQQRNVETPSAVHVDGFFKNLDHGAGETQTSGPHHPGMRDSRDMTVLSTVSGHSKSRPGAHSNTVKSQGSLSIDSLSGSSSYSQKIAFSETNMQSSLGYLP